MSTVFPLPETLISSTAEIELLAGGYGFIEGPVWWEGRLYFSDIPNSLRYSWDPVEGARVVDSRTNKGNGMAIDSRGGLVVCEHSTSSLVRYPSPADHAGRQLVATHYGDRELNSPNDVVCLADGRVYFTDPVYGRISERVGVVRDVPLDFRAVFLLRPGAGSADVVPVAKDFDGPNGLCFSPDRAVLYVNDTPRKHIRTFSVLDDGTLGDGRVLADVTVAGDRPGFPDGMKCDELGNIWVTGPGGICVFTPQGQFLGALDVPGVVGSHAWGGDNLDELYICATDRLFRIRTAVRGDRLP
jgi:gluconolactonase